MATTIAEVRELAKHLTEQHYWAGMPAIELTPAGALDLLKHFHSTAPKQGNHPE